jgi:hypothetical protein
MSKKLKPTIPLLQRVQQAVYAALTPAPVSTPPTPLAREVGYLRFAVTVFRNGDFFEEEQIASYYEVNKHGDLHFYSMLQPTPLATYRRECWESVGIWEEKDDE